MSEVQNSGRMVRARGVAEARLYHFAAEPPGGPSGPPPFAQPPVLAHFDSPDAVVCPCGEDHSNSTWEALGAAGLADSGSDRAPDISGHEVYCGCDDCHATPPCAGCGRTCDDDFCFCPPTCAICGGDGTDLSLEQFTFTIEPGTLPPGDYQECFSPDMLTAFWDDDELIVADTQSDARWRFVYFEPQNNSPTSRQYYTWYCKRIGVANPCDENFMKAISS